MKFSFGTVLRVAVSLIALILIPYFLRDKLTEAFTILRNEVRFPVFVIAAAIYGLSFLVLTQRMQFILHYKKIYFSFLDTLYFSFLGLFFSLFLPSAIGGDVMKAVYLAKHARSRADVFSCLIVDRLSGFVIVIFLAFLSSALLNESWNPVPHSISYLALAIMAGCFLAVFIRPEIIPWIFSKLRFLPHRFQEKLNQFYDSLSGFFHNRKLIIQSLACSLIAQCLFIAAYYFVGQSLDASIPITRFFILVPMMTMISMAPSINGLGVREAGALFLLKMYMPPERALAMTVLIDVLIYFFSFSGGLWYLVRGHRHK